MTDVAHSEQALADARSALAVAEQDVGDAEDLLATLRERIREGDSSVTADELDAQRRLIEFARERSEGARRVAARADADARHAHFVAFGAEARALADLDDSDIADIFTAILDLARDFWSRLAARDARLRDFGERGRDIAAKADQHGERELLRTAGVVDAARGRVTVARADGSTRVLRPVWPSLVTAHVLSVLMDEQLEAQRGATGKRGHVMPSELMAAVMPLTAAVPKDFPALPKLRHTI